MSNIHDVEKLKKVNVESSNLLWVAYDEENKNLYVAFKNNSVYVYYNVDKRVFDELLSAPSHGHYHAVNIKWKYKYERVI